MNCEWEERLWCLLELMLPPKTAQGRLAGAKRRITRPPSTPDTCAASLPATLPSRGHLLPFPVEQAVDGPSGRADPDLANRPRAEIRMERRVPGDVR